MARKNNWPILDQQQKRMGLWDSANWRDGTRGMATNSSQIYGRAPGTLSQAVEWHHHTHLCGRSQHSLGANKETNCLSAQLSESSAGSFRQVTSFSDSSAFLHCIVSYCKYSNDNTAATKLFKITALSAFLICTWMLTHSFHQRGMWQLYLDQTIHQLFQFSLCIFFPKKPSRIQFCWSLCAFCSSPRRKLLMTSSPTKAPSCWKIWMLS